VVDRVVLHVGLPKSGTTYLQAVLGQNKSSLMQRAQLLYPGEKWADQVNAVRDLRGFTVGPALRAKVDGAWDRLVAEMAQWSGTSVMSMEWLGQADRGQIKRLAADLAFAEVHVLFTVRDLARMVPAAWQEFMQNGFTWAWPDFLAQVAADEPDQTPAGRLFWRQQDTERLISRWSSIIPVDRVHVVTVPPAGAPRDELWRRVAQVLDIAPDGYDLDVTGANASLGAESAELMRRLNLRLEQRSLELPVETYNRVFKHRLAKGVLVQRKGEEATLTLPATYHPWVSERAARLIEAITASGTHVIGDLADLRPRLPATAQGVTEISPEGVLAAAVDALITTSLPSSGPGPRSGQEEPRRRGAPAEPEVG
jgi:hypothetical protein